MLDVILGLGANLGDPPAAFAAALEELSGRAETVAVSALWRSRPVGPPQPDYTNAAALIGWPGGPRELIDRCHEIEAELGRDRSSEERWGPRLIDLDLLLARDLIWRGPGLELPHPRLHERAFALVPAAEVAPDWVHPHLGRTLADLAATIRATDPDALFASEPGPS